MSRWRPLVGLGAGMIVLTACAAAAAQTEDSRSDQMHQAVATAPPTTINPTRTTPPSSPPSSVPPATPESTTTTTSTTTSTSTTITEPTAATSREDDRSHSTELTEAVYDAGCVVRVEPGDTLEAIVARFDDDTVTVEAVRAENDLADAVVEVGQLLDVCVANGLDDVTGEERNTPDPHRTDESEPAENSAASPRDLHVAVERQQLRLNELFEGYGIAPLLVDGISGPVTRQRLCAARLALGLPVGTWDMVPGSLEEHVLMNAPALRVPFTSAILSDRWILIDRTCQVMFAGERADRLTFVFPTSTGEPGHDTRDQNRTPAFRYNPASPNGGWHNSTLFPVAGDNPLNGNMYRPLYFDRGQAIHGANNVPRSPQSKGCARLRVEDMDQLVAWLGLHDITSPTHDPGRINVTVNVQGSFVWP